MVHNILVHVQSWDFNFYWFCIYIYDFNLQKWNKYEMDFPLQISWVVTMEMKNWWKLWQTPITWTQPMYLIFIFVV